jgi:beta-glucanase (GH16 family)
LEAYTRRTNNARIEHGCLVIEARREGYQVKNGVRRDYTSARLKTQRKASWKFGRMEARIKIPRGQGMWPAFWTLGTNIDSVGWPACGEIDIMENIGRQPSTVHGTIHGPGFKTGGVGKSYSLSNGKAFADDFHVFAIEWERERVRWLIDDHLYFTATPKNLPADGKWVFTEPQYILLNLAVGGNWPGAPNDTTVFPQQMLVDYVRVYAPANVMKR